jgi:putative phosphoribosyl transferase
MFRNRAEAGQLLAAELAGLKGKPDVLVMGLLRGGVPVAFEIARALHAPLDILLVRKLGVPTQPELAMGAVGAGGIRIIDHELVYDLRISTEILEKTIERQEVELRHRERLYSDVRSSISVRDRVTLIVDDGIATGSSILAAISVLRAQQPKSIIVAVPVAPTRARSKIERVADGFVCLYTAHDFSAVGAFYHDFGQVEDSEVRRLLSRFHHSASG